MNFNLHWIIVGVFLCVSAFVGAYYLINRVLFTKQNNKVMSKVKLKLCKKEDGSTLKSISDETMDTDLSLIVTNKKITHIDKLNYVYSIESINDRNYFWYGYWFNVDQFLYMRGDNTFEWSMPNHIGLGKFTYTIINENKADIKFYFNNSQEREWTFEKIDNDTIEIESFSKYSDGKLIFVLYKDNDY